MKLPGIVTNVTAFGAFVDIGVHQDGLVHISQLADQFVKDPAEVVKVGDDVTALITRVDPLEQKISLSIRALTDKEQRAELKKLAAQQAASQTTTLGDLLAEKLAEKAGGEEE